MTRTIVGARAANGRPVMVQEIVMVQEMSVFFKDGAHAKWHVEGHVKKARLLPSGERQVAGLMGAG